MLRSGKEVVRCPVGKEKIGERWVQENCTAYCEDCKVMYYFKGYEDLPYKNVSGNSIKPPVKCGCFGCGR